MIRKPTKNDLPKVGEWVLPYPFMRDEVVGRPEKVDSCTESRVKYTTRSGRATWMKTTNVRYIASTEEVANRAYAMSRLCAEDIKARKAACEADIEVIR